MMNPPMQPATQPGAAGTRPAAGRSFWLTALVLLLAYVAVRIIAWRHTVLLEDTDSVALLDQIRAWLDGLHSLRFGRMITPDNTPVYPAFSALLSLPGWSGEFAARLCSLSLSVVLFLAVLGLGLTVAEPPAVLVGLALLAFNPVLIRFSVSVLTEPSYLGLVYLGLWIFMRQYLAPTAGSAVLLGVVFGLAFLDRTEGILYLVFIPAMQVAHYWLTRDRSYSARRLLAWGGTFVVVFALLAGPQIWRVSHRLGSLAINGRQTWAVMLGRDFNGVVRERKLWGLDYSPAQMNLPYVQSHPEVYRKLVSSRGARDYLVAAARNLTLFYRTFIPTMLGVFGIALLAFGLLALYQGGQRFEILLVGAFIVNGLGAPVVQNLLLRHVLILLPMLLCVAGIGAVDLVRRVLGEPLQARRVRVGLLLVTAACLSAEALPLRDALFYTPTHNNEYSPAELQEPARIVRRIGAEELHRRPTICDRRPYLAMYSGANMVWLPFTDIEGLRTYLALNQVDLLFLEYPQAATRPLLRAFEGPAPPAGFELLYRKDTETNGRLELYRVRVSPPTAAQ
jgi:hypothetical protein